MFHNHLCSKCYSDILKDLVVGTSPCSLNCHSYVLNSLILSEVPRNGCAVQNAETNIKVDGATGDTVQLGGILFCYSLA
jgi:hypothetical protein